MKIQFDDPLFEAWTQRFLFTMSEGSCEIGEIKATAARIPDGDHDAWYREWTAIADRLFAEAEACAAKNARVSARPLSARFDLLPLVVSFAVWPSDRRARQSRLCP
jgi:hypothetical protein